MATDAASGVKASRSRVHVYVPELRLYDTVVAGAAAEDDESVHGH
jgi:hypothetical protein